MRTLTKLTGILLAAATLTVWPVMAQPTPATPATTNAPPAKPRTEYRGIIASVDTATMTVSLKGRPGSPTTKVKLTHDTKIKKDGQPAQFTDLVEGLRITGSGKKGEDGVWTANTLNIRTAPATPKAAPATTKTPE